MEYGFRIQAGKQIRDGDLLRIQNFLRIFRKIYQISTFDRFHYDDRFVILATDFVTFLYTSAIDKFK